MAAILDFYQKVREAQERAKVSLKSEPLLLKKEWKEFLARQGFPLLEKNDFPLDIEASSALFQSLCQIGREANPRMVDEVRKIEEAVINKKLDLKQVFKERHSEKKIEKVADDYGFDKKIFQFLVESVLRPSIEATVEQLRNAFDVRDWTKGYCPMCGSLPFLSLMKEETGKRYLLCSYCGYQWRINRLICPFCNNNDHESLHYFYGEGEESFRIDLCDQCHQYIKDDRSQNHSRFRSLLRGYRHPPFGPFSLPKRLQATRPQSLDPIKQSGSLSNRRLSLLMTGLTKA